MRIVYLTDRISCRGGADQHLRQVIAAVSEKHEVIIGHGGRHAGASMPGSPYRTARLRCLASPKREEKQLDALRELVAGADVVHLQNVMNPLAIKVAVATGRAIVTIQDHRVFCPGRGKWTPAAAVCREPMSSGLCCSCFDEREYAGAIFELTVERQRALAGVRRIVVLSQYMARELGAVGFEDAQVLPPWVEVGAPPIAGGPLLVAGRLVSHKGVLDAYRSWRSSGVTRSLQVAGDGPLATELEGHLGGRCLLGWLSSTQLRQQLHGALALLLPCGWEEPFGIVGVEALAEGTPVILMRSGGVTDWADAGCLCVERGDLEGLTAAIRQLDADPGRAVVLGAEGQAMVRQRFAREPLLARLLSLYELVASS